MPAVSDYSPLDRAYSEAVPYSAKPRKLEDPIIPINMLGQTVPEQDPSGGNIIQNVQAAIRRGAGNIQLVMTTSPEAAIGGRFKAYGHEVREELKEILLANDVKMSGIELPTAISNLSGFNRQQGAFSEETRERDIAEVRDAIRFAADVAGGGGVDILSWEFDRNFSDAKWNRDKSGKMIFEPAGGEKGVEKEVVQIVDTVTGRVSAIRKGERCSCLSIPRRSRQRTKASGTIRSRGTRTGCPRSRSGRGRISSRSQRTPRMMRATR